MHPCLLACNDTKLILKLSACAYLTHVFDVLESQFKNRSSWVKAVFGQLEAPIAVFTELTDGSSLIVYVALSLRTPISQLAVS